MSMTDEERATLVTLELKKAHETFEEIGILTAANNGVVRQIVSIILFSMP